MRIIFMLILVLVMFPFTVFPLGDDIDDVYGNYLISGINRNITMDLENVSLINVLKALSQQSGLNFISTEAIRNRKLTLYFKDVPLKNAMDIIFKANGLSYDYFPDAKIFVVKEIGKPSIELKTKVYHLRYAHLKNSNFQKAVGDIADNSNGGKGIAEAVKGVLTENGKVTEDDYDNSLIVVDLPSQFPIIDKVISSLDKPQPKVMIDVEMLDVSKSLVDKLGINYSDGLNVAFRAGAYMTTFPLPDRLLKKRGVDLSGNMKASSIDFTSLTSVLQFLSSDTTTRFLARPKIITLSSVTAEVNVTTNEAIGVKESTSDTSTSYEVERTDTGTKLEVTPYVDLVSREITMAVKLYNRDASKGSGIVLESMKRGEVKNPEERGEQSVVRLKNGQTLLIGGLIEHDNKRLKNKVPFLGDVPIIGSLFRSTDKRGEDRELLVFLTPHIVTDSNPNVGYLGNIGIMHEQSDLSSRDEAVSIALDSFSKK